MQARRYPQFVEASPRGLVPARVHDGVCVNDSVVCCEYLADISPPGVLLPTPAASRAQVRSLRFRERKVETPSPSNHPPMRPGGAITLARQCYAWLGCTRDYPHVSVEQATTGMVTRRVS